MSYYHSGNIEKSTIYYLTIVEGLLTESLRNNKIESIVISRHGHGRHNEFNFGTTDARLTSKGRKDTGDTALRIRDNIKHLTPKYIFTSELFRTMQTAAIFMKALDYVQPSTNVIRNFYIVRCNHELSGNQIKDETNCDKNLEDALNSIKWKDKSKSIFGEENRPKRLDEKMESFDFSEVGSNLNNAKVVLTTEELNCSTQRYTESCDKKIICSIISR